MEASTLLKTSSIYRRKIKIKLYAMLFSSLEKVALYDKMAIRISKNDEILNMAGEYHKLLKPRALMIIKTKAGTR